MGGTRGGKGKTGKRATVGRRKGPSPGSVRYDPFDNGIFDMIDSPFRNETITAKVTKKDTKRSSRSNHRIQNRSRRRKHASESETESESGSDESDRLFSYADFYAHESKSQIGDSATPALKESPVAGTVHEVQENVFFTMDGSEPVPNGDHTYTHSHTATYPHIVVQAHVQTDTNLNTPVKQNINIISDANEQVMSVQENLQVSSDAASDAHLTIPVGSDSGKNSKKKSNNNRRRVDALADEALDDYINNCGDAGELLQYLTSYSAFLHSDMDIRDSDTSDTDYDSDDVYQPQQRRVGGGGGHGRVKGKGKKIMQVKSKGTKKTVSKKKAKKGANEDTAVGKGLGWKQEKLLEHRLTKGSAEKLSSMWCKGEIQTDTSKGVAKAMGVVTPQTQLGPIFHAHTSHTQTVTINNSENGSFQNATDTEAVNNSVSMASEMMLTGEGIHALSIDSTKRNEASAVHRHMPETGHASDMSVRTIENTRQSEVLTRQNHTNYCDNEYDLSLSDFSNESCSDVGSKHSSGRSVESSSDVDRFLQNEEAFRETGGISLMDTDGFHPDTDDAVARTVNLAGGIDHTHQGGHCIRSRRARRGEKQRKKSETKRKDTQGHKTVNTAKPSTISRSSASRNADPIPSSNVGSKMLKAMGWSEGTGLGRHRDGIVAPLAAARNNGRSGLGNG
eukprot:CFRG7343T1